MLGQGRRGERLTGLTVSRGHAVEEVGEAPEMAQIDGAVAAAEAEGAPDAMIATFLVAASGSTQSTVEEVEGDTARTSWTCC